MRFCPFCSAENPDEASHCGTCARRLPPLSPRRRARKDETAAGARSGAGSREATAQQTDEQADEKPSLLSRVALGPAARRREPSPPEPRAPGDPARRQSDAGNGHSSPRSAALPPPPSRVERDQAATRQAIREVSQRTATATPAPPTAEDSSDQWPAPARRPPTPPEDDHDDWGTPAPPPPRAASPSEPRPPTPSPAPSSAPSSAPRSPTLPEPPPTRVAPVSESRGAFTAPDVVPVPEVPEPGLLNAVSYFLSFARARWQRRSAIKDLQADIKEDTASLDGVLGTLGMQARSLKIDNRVLSAENAAIDEAEARRDRIDRECGELDNRQAEENAKFAEIEVERQGKVAEAETNLERAERELGSYEAQRRGLRDKRKEIDHRQKNYLRNAEDREEQSAKAQLGDARARLRRAAEDLRRDAARLDPERQDIERRIAALEKPMSKAAAKVESLKGELESVRRSLNDAREGHRHRLAEIEAEQGRKSRELAQAEAEIQRRLVTLGTLVNLHRIETPEFDDLYARIDNLRAAIGARTREIDRFTAERDAYDKGSLWRGAMVLAGGVVAMITLLVILWAVF